LHESNQNTKKRQIDKLTNRGKQKVKQFTWFSLYVGKSAFVALAMTVLALAYSLLLDMPSARAAVPTTINFQGRLANASGVTMANGSYNMRFRIHTAPTGGSLLWTETRETTNRVVVTNGLFSVQLGSVTPLTASIFNNASTLYFEIELPTPATATCSTASCQTWTEGAMTPRSVIAASAYAMNSATLDGLASSDLAKIATTNTFTATQTINVASATALNVTNGATSLLVADTSNTVVKIGNPGASTLSNVRLLTTNAEISSTVRIGDATNGVEFSASGVIYRGTGRPTKSVTLTPEYAGATFTGDGTNNTGSLSSDFCSSSSLLNVNATACAAAADEHNYYAWANTQATAQDYDIYVRYRMPADYDTGSMTDMKIFGWGTTSATEVVGLSLYKANATACSTITNAITANTTWNEATQASPLGACTIAAGDMVTFKVHVVAGQNNTARGGEITFTYRNKL
jgi:hypothetical protein